MPLVQAAVEATGLRRFYLYKNAKRKTLVSVNKRPSQRKRKTNTSRIESSPPSGYSSARPETQEEGGQDRWCRGLPPPRGEVERSRRRSSGFGTRWLRAQREKNAQFNSPQDQAAGLDVEETLLVGRFVDGGKLSIP